MWPAVRAILHSMSPETAHSFSMRALKLVPKMHAPEKLGDSCKVFGLDFPNRIGLAAGFDKNGEHIDELGKLGFGFIEVGTITPRPQPGSPRPRLFRLPQAGALINRLGFNSLGADHAARLLARQGRSFSGVLGCNIGRNKDTEPSNARKDYLLCLEKLYGVADYFTLNISSPNTPGLHLLRKPVFLQDLLYELTNLREKLATSHRHRAPILLKISPDLSDEEIGHMADVIIESDIDGVITSNTTTNRDREIIDLPYGGQPGGLSGPPLRPLADQALVKWRTALPRKFGIIGVGGISCANDAQDKFAAGADLVQIYTGLIYKGPQLVVDCARAAKTYFTGSKKQPVEEVKSEDNGEAEVAADS